MGHLSKTLLTKDFKFKHDDIDIPIIEFLRLCFSFLGLEKVNGLFPFYFEKGKYVVTDSLNSRSELHICLQ